MLSVKKKGALNLVFSLSYKIITMVFGIVLPLLFITSYGSELNGLQSSVQQIFTYTTLLEAGIGAATLQSLYKPVASKDRDKINGYLSATSKYYNKIGVIYFLLLFVVAIGYAIFVPVDTMVFMEVMVYVAVAGALNGVNFFYLAKLKLLISAEGDEYIVSILSTVTYVLTSTAKIILISQGLNIILLQVSHFLINIGITLIYYLIAKKKYPWLSFKASPNYEGMKQKNSVLIHRISSLVFQNVDVLLLTFMCGSESLEIVSIYTIYKLVVNMITTIVASMGESVNFIFGREMNNGEEDHTNYKKVIDVFNVVYSAVAFALYVVTYLLILPFLKLYTADMDLNYIIPVLPWLYIAIEILTVGREAMLKTIEVAGHFKATQWRAIVEVVLNLLISIIAVIVCRHFWGNIGGLYGVLVGTIASMLYRTVDINIYANKHILKRKPWKTFRVMLTNLCLFIVVAFCIKPIVPSIGNYFEFMFHGIWLTLLILVIFIGVQLLMNIKETKILFGYINRRKKKIRKEN